MNLNNYFTQEHILLVDKPVGPTSFDVIRFLRRELDIKKMGHAGTLDPLASGLMIIGVGPGTKQMEQFLKLSKVYEADILLGRSTTTGDLEGEVLQHTAHSTQHTEDEVNQVLASVVGTLSLPVPLYSAIKVDGKPLYKYAREGKVPPRIPVKDMEVRAAELLNRYEDELGHHLVVRFDVGSGAYIRVLAEELGRRLGAPACLAGLRRTSISDYSVEDALCLEYVDGILSILEAKE